MKLFVVLSVIAVAVTAHHVHHDHETTEKGGPPRAIASLSGGGIEGIVTFTQQADGKVLIEGKLTGHPKGHYGFHVYQTGDVSESCAKTGGHFNPDNKDHGHPDDENRHAGDLGNIFFDENRVSKINIVDSLISLEGRYSIIGRAVAVTEGKDDHGQTDHPDSKVTGNAGRPVACGVIGYLN